MSIQGTPEWFAERCGKVTASRISDVLATIKSGEAAGRRNYRAQLVAERLTGVAADSFTNSAMQWGTDTEPFARAAYEAYAHQFVDEVGFIVHPEIRGSGASPDSLVGNSGLVEIKCPNTATHIDYLISKKIPDQYQVQMLWQIACAKRRWCDFVSFDPRMPEHLQLLVIRFNRDDARISFIESEVRKFIGEVEDVITQLENL